MANALIVRAGTGLLSPTGEGRAAQYVRMSTDHQRYSTENQAAAIAVYAAQHDLVIVRTYKDEGRSGLRIEQREGLLQLIEDVRGGRVDFDHILVYDVSRWGRFQDIDEPAYYEFTCRQAGVKVCYCAEQFDNDGSMIASIVKNLKRVMAAEYSRELSVKVYAGACRVASLGFKQGGTAGYGLQRELVDESGISKGFLLKGQRKHLQTDRVFIRPGAVNEQRIVARIFREFVVHRRPQGSIVRWLNNEQVPNHRGTQWSYAMVRQVLSNEAYIGNSVYNRSSCRLKQARKPNPPEQWIRATGLFEPVVDKSIFIEAQKLLKEKQSRWSDEWLLQKLRETLALNRKLSASILAATENMPSAALYAHRFGSLRGAFSRVGYIDPERNYDYADAQKASEAELIRQVETVVGQICACGVTAVFDPQNAVITVAGRLAISVRMARYYVGRCHAPCWLVHRRRQEPAGLILALRLDKETNREVVDYFLFPLRVMGNNVIGITATSRSRFAVYRCPTVNDVLQAIMEKVAAVLA